MVISRRKRTFIAKKIEDIKIFVNEMKQRARIAGGMLLVTKLPCSIYNIPSKGLCYTSEKNCDYYSSKKSNYSPTKNSYSQIIEYRNYLTKQEDKSYPFSVYASTFEGETIIFLMNNRYGMQ